MLKKILLLLTLMLGVFTFSAAKQDVTVYCDDGYFPFSYEENGQAKGLYIDVLKEAFSRMDSFNVTLEPVPWKRGKFYMEQGQGFALTPAFYHGHDWGYLYPYSLPFNTETIITVFLKDNLTQQRNNIPDDYIGLKVGNIAGFDGWVPAEMKKLIDAGKIDLEESRNSEVQIRKLVAKRVDCIIMERLAFEFQLRKLQENGTIPKNIEFSYQAVIGEDPVSIGYSESNNPSYKYQFQKEIDNILYKMKKAGEFEKIFSEFEE